MRTTNKTTAREVLREVFGHGSFRPGQEAAIEKLLAGRSVLAIFPTGGGKSACYQVPALLLPGTTVVVSPLLALMKDQVDALVKKGVAAARFDSTLGASESARVLDDLVSGRLRLLYVSPERLASERFVTRLRRLRVPLVAIDEAHCLSEWGHGFRPEYLKLARVVRDLGIERVLALTATATPRVAADVRREFGIAAEDQVQTGFRRPNLDLDVAPCRADEKGLLLLERLASEPGPAIVYVTLQQTAEDVAMHLVANGVSARPYHAGMERDERVLVQEAFMSGAARVVVATIAFGMGIDKADIRAVYHWNLPKSLESYAQEIGRAGRDGLPARCLVLACGDDRAVLEGFAQDDTPSSEALLGLVRAVLAGGVGGKGDVDVVDLSPARLGLEHAMRALAVHTALTYLELEGALAHVGPFYAEYRLKLARPLEATLAGLDPERAAFLGSVVAEARVGRVWRTLEVERVAWTLGEPRERIVAALGWLEERGDAQVEASGLRHRYRVPRRTRSPEALAAHVDRLFREREARDLGRIEDVVRFLEREGCLARGLLEHFGEELAEDCGRCASCRAGGGRRISTSLGRETSEAVAGFTDRDDAGGR